MMTTMRMMIEKQEP